MSKGIKADVATLTPEPPGPGDYGELQIEATGELVTVRLHPRHVNDPIALVALRAGDAMIVRAPMILMVEATVRPIR